MNKSTLTEQIGKLQKSIASPAVDEKLKAGMRTKLADLESKLAQLEQEESAQADDAKPEPAASAADKPAKEKGPIAPAKPKATKENKVEAVANCSAVISAVKKALQDFETGKAAPRRKEKAKKKRASEIVSGGIVGTVTRVVKLELTKDKVGKIDADKLEDAKKSFKEAIRHLRTGLGGIKTDNSGIIEQFEKEFDGIIKLVRDKQKSVKEAA